MAWHDVTSPNITSHAVTKHDMASHHVTSNVHHVTPDASTARHRTARHGAARHRTVRHSAAQRRAAQRGAAQLTAHATPPRSTLLTHRRSSCSGRSSGSPRRWRWPGRSRCTGTRCPGERIDSTACRRRRATRASRGIPAPCQCGRIRAARGAGRFSRQAQRRQRLGQPGILSADLRLFRLQLVDHPQHTLWFVRLTCSI